MDQKERRKRVMARSIKLGHCVCDPRKPCPCILFRDKNICTCAGDREAPAGEGKKVRLTRFVRSAGCAGKISQKELHEVLGALPVVKDPRVSGFDAFDDSGGPAAVEKTFEETVLYAHGLGGKPEVLATRVQMAAGMHEVINYGEDAPEVGREIEEELTTQSTQEEHKVRTRRLTDHIFPLLLCVFCALSWLILPCSVHAAETKPKLALVPSGDEKAKTIVELMEVEEFMDGVSDKMP